MYGNDRGMDTPQRCMASHPRKAGPPRPASAFYPAPTFPLHDVAARTSRDCHRLRRTVRCASRKPHSPNLTNGGPTCFVLPGDAHVETINMIQSLLSMLTRPCMLRSRSPSLCEPCLSTSKAGAVACPLNQSITVTPPRSPYMTLLKPLQEYL